MRKEPLRRKKHQFESELGSEFVALYHCNGSRDSENDALLRGRAAVGNTWSITSASFEIFGLHCTVLGKTRLRHWEVERRTEATKEGSFRKDRGTCTGHTVHSFHPHLAHTSSL